jgi:hypothetical protein
MSPQAIAIMEQEQSGNHVEEDDSGESTVLDDIHELLLFHQLLNRESHHDASRECHHGIESGTTDLDSARL